MCRWIAYSGDPIFIDQLVVQPTHSLLAQSLDTRMNHTRDGSLWATNGDGFGIGWYGKKVTPGLFRNIQPAWNDMNLHEVTSQIESRLFFAHIRATTTGGVQLTNCHPFKYKNWLFQHNGHIRDFEIIRKDLQMDIANDLFPKIQGNTDSETFFFLTLTYGLQDNPRDAIQKAITRVEKAFKDHGLDDHDVQLSCSLTDGHTTHTIRYCNVGKPKSQFYTTGRKGITDISGNTSGIPENAIIVVSEPLDDLSSFWHEIPANSFGSIQDGMVDVQCLF